MDHKTLRAEVGPIRSMVEALKWTLSRTPPGAFVDAVAQDEYTHDIIVRVGDSTFVVFDTT